MKKNIQENWLTVITGVMLLLAIPSIWPYGYFNILRWVVTGVALYNAYLALESKKNSWAFIMGIIVILFNPIAPIFLQKQTWVVLDLITAIVMFVSVGKLKIYGESNRQK